MKVWEIVRDIVGFGIIGGLIFYAFYSKPVKPAKKTAPYSSAVYDKNEEKKMAEFLISQEKGELPDWMKGDEKESVKEFYNELYKVESSRKRKPRIESYPKYMWNELGFSEEEQRKETQRKSQKSFGIGMERLESIINKK